jgi:hypothetical protein
MIKYYCDFCKKELMGSIYGYELEKVETHEFTLYSNLHEKFVFFNNHICYDCFEKIANWYDAIRGVKEEQLIKID